MVLNCSYPKIFKSTRIDQNVCQKARPDVNWDVLHVCQGCSHSATHHPILCQKLINCLLVPRVLQGNILGHPVFHGVLKLLEVHLELALVLAGLLVQLDDGVLLQVLVQLHCCCQALGRVCAETNTPEEGCDVCEEHFVTKVRRQITIVKLVEHVPHSHHIGLGLLERRRSAAENFPNLSGALVVPHILGTEAS